jgi:hypothetical protein
VLGVASVALADVQGVHSINWISGHYTSPGGEFTIYGGTLNVADVSAYANVAKNQTGTPYTGTISSPSFQTFCLEKTEYINLGGSYDMSKNTAAVKGGTSTMAGDAISNATGWLYYQFATGALASYNYGTAASAAALQNAIWFLENEGGSNSGQAGIWITAAQGAAGTGDVGPGGYVGALGNVVVLNLWTSTNHNASTVAQDQLYLDPGTGSVPVPGAVVLGLIGLGLVGVKMRRYA